VPLTVKATKKSNKFNTKVSNTIFCNLFEQDLASYIHSSFDC